jgi:hypothetical protein
MLKMMTTEKPVKANLGCNKFAWSAAVGGFSLVLVCLFSSWPEIYDFATSKDSSIWSRLFSLPVHLSDDVMISLRSGYILREMGYAAFNRHDLAQASTSNVSPYLFALLSSFVSSNTATILYASLGALSVASTLAILFYGSRSALNGLIVVAALIFSSTSREYSLNGWDHLFQALFLVITASLFMAGRLGKFKLLLIGISLAVACLWRPDAAIFSAAILGFSFFELKKKKDWLLWGLVPFSSVLIPFILHNIIVFGYIMPTTARLKIGASPSFDYAAKYLLTNGVRQFSAITIVVFLTCFYLYFLVALGSRRSHVLVFSAVATSIVSAINSDVFGAGRMFWGAACVLAVVCCRLAPPLFVCEASDTGSSLINYGQFNDFYAARAPYGGFLLKPFSVILALIIILPTASSIAQRVKSSVISSREISFSQTASQYVLTRWIDQHLRPEDGSIGFFYLGVSFHLQKFEIADFLGKADEAIAQSPIKWGPPGHNKWDISESLNKWKPQAIVPAGPSDFSRKEVLSWAATSLANKEDFGFAPALVADPSVSRDYDYCFVRPFGTDLEDKWGLFLRKDIVAKAANVATCRESALSKE